MTLGRAATLLLLFAACATRPPEPPIETTLESIAAALRLGRFEQAVEEVARARWRHPTNADAAAWSSAIADLLWQDDRAVTADEQTLARALGKRVASIARKLSA